MRLPIICSRCMSEDIASARPFATVEWQDDGRYEVTCPKGHASITILQEQKFELLFDIGAYALIDGYYREAVSSFTSSLERFYEFFVVSVLFENGIGESVLTSAWKDVVNQSERQLGAFIFLYVREFKNMPALLSKKSIAFRNDVIHKGKIPSRARALEYGTEILGLIRPQLRELKQKFPNGVRAAIFEHLKRSRRADDEKPATMTIATIISLSRDDDAYNSRLLGDAIKELRQWNEKEGRPTGGP